MLRTLFGCNRSIDTLIILSINSQTLILSGNLEIGKIRDTNKLAVLVFIVRF